MRREPIITFVITLVAVLLAACTDEVALPTVSKPVLVKLSIAPNADTRVNVALPFTHRTAKVTINPTDDAIGGTPQADATVIFTNLTGVSEGNEIQPCPNADGTFSAIVAPQTIAASTVLASISWEGFSFDYKPASAQELLSAKDYTFNISYDTEQAYLRMPLTIEAKEAGATVSFHFELGQSVYYSTDYGQSWSAYTSDDPIILTAVGGKVQFKSVADSQYWSNMSFTDYCYVYGNIMSMVLQDVDEDFSLSTTLRSDYTFYEFFYGNEYLLSHPFKSILLPATTLAEYCYYGMLSYCTSLTKALVLSANSIPYRCYYGMFWGCSALNSVTCLAGSYNADATEQWLGDVASTGTFTKKAGVDWPYGGNGIPGGWTIVEQ